MEPEWTDRKAKWRALHPNRDRAQRIAQNENRRLRRAGKTRMCDACGAPNAEVHHISYTPTGYNSGSVDLCEKCHQATHREDGTGQACAQASTRDPWCGGLAHHSDTTLSAGSGTAPSRESSRWHEQKAKAKAKAKAEQETDVG